MKPRDTGHLALSTDAAKVVGIVALAIPLTVFIALRWLHEPKIAFREVSIVSQSPEEPAATLAKMASDESALIRRAHIEIIALTLLALSFLFFLFNRADVTKWTKYFLIISAVACVAACWSQW